MDISSKPWYSAVFYFCSAFSHWFLALYFAAPKSLRNGILFFGSLIFYGWGEPVYISLLLFSTLVDFIHGKLVGYFKEKGNLKGARLAVASSAVINLSLLFVFKYTDFVIRSFNELTGSSFPPSGAGSSHWYFLLYLSDHVLYH